MAEFIGVAASSATLIEVSARTLSELYCYLSKVKNADHRFQSIVNEVEMTSRLLSQLQLHKEREKTGDENGPSVLDVASEEALTRSFDDIRRVKENLERYDCERKKSKMRPLRKVAWPLEEKKIRKIMEQIQEVRALISASFVTHVLEDTTAMRFDKERQDLLSWLCPLDISTHHTYVASLEIRSRHSGRWFLEMENSDYQIWLRGGIGHLWITGLPGCGKTILLASAFEDLDKRHNRPDDPVVVISYWFDHKNPNETPVNAFLESIVRQLLEKDPCGFEKIRQLQKDCGRGRPCKDCKLALCDSLIAQFDLVYLLIDGVDECEDPLQLLDDIGRLVRCFADHSKRGLRLLLSGRFSSAIAAKFDTLGNNLILRVNEANHEDINNYVQEKLAETGLLQNGGLDDVTASIVEKANGL